MQSGGTEQMEAAEAAGLAQQDQALEEEIERLLEENDELKVHISI